MTQKSTKPYICQCGKTFNSKRAVTDHYRGAHPGIPAVITLNPNRRRDRPANSEPSMAERSIAAMLDHDMGVANADYDWLVRP